MTYLNKKLILKLIRNKKIMKIKKNSPVKRQNSMHTQIDCKSKIELSKSINNKTSIDKESNTEKKVNNVKNQKRNSFQSNQKIILKPVTKKKHESLKDSINTPPPVKKSPKILCKSNKNVNNKFRNAINYNSKLRNQNQHEKSKFILNCSDKKRKPKYLSEKELQLNLEDKNLDYEYKDNKIEIVYNSPNNYIITSATQKGIFIKNKIEKEKNQDESLIIEDVCGIKNYSIYCIMDGHGSNGHYISNYIKEKIIQNFNNISFYFHKITNKFNIKEYPENILELIKKNLTKNNYQKIKDFYKLIDEGLSANEIHFDINFSGSTCIILFKIGNDLICSNVGDSRAIMTKENNEIIELSKDQKPENENEKKRIESMGGIISQCNDLYDDGKEGGPFRIWVKGCDYPGISMSRSIGDKIAHDIGVIYEPEILNFNIDSKCECIIIGSDGIFQYLKNEEVVNIIKPFINEKQTEKACKEIIKKASLSWVENDSSIDDITVTIIILKV